MEKPPGLNSQPYKSPRADVQKVKQRLPVTLYDFVSDEVRPITNKSNARQEIGRDPFATSRCPRASDFRRNPSLDRFAARISTLIDISRWNRRYLAFTNADRARSPDNGRANRAQRSSAKLSVTNSGRAARSRSPRTMMHATNV